MDEKKPNKANKIFFFAAGILLLLCAALVIIPRLTDVGAAGKVTVYLGDKVYTTVPLGKAQSVVIDQGNGFVNEIEITENGAYMKNSTCEGHDCVKQGEVNLENINTRVLGGWIICLPHGIAVELTAAE